MLQILLYRGQLEEGRTQAVPLVVRQRRRIKLIVRPAVSRKEWLEKSDTHTKLCLPQRRPRHARCHHTMSSGDYSWWLPSSVLLGLAGGSTETGRLVVFASEAFWLIDAFWCFVFCMLTSVVQAQQSYNSVLSFLFQWCCMTNIVGCISCLAVAIHTCESILVNQWLSFVINSGDSTWTNM